MSSSFDIPLDLPHAGTVVERIERELERLLDREEADHDDAFATVALLRQMLSPYKMQGDNPPREKGLVVAESAAQLGRELVDEIEKLGLGQDRLGQCVRNLFECLELGAEGAAISLRAGENPNSPQRP